MRQTKFLLLVCLVAGCSTATRLLPPEAELSRLQQKVPGITYGEIKQGAGLYKTNCSGCHRLHSPAEYTVDGWNKALVEMFPRAHMTDERKRTLVRNYLFALSK